MDFNNVNYVSKESWGELANPDANSRRRDCAILDKLQQPFGLYDQEPKWVSPK